SLLIRAPPTSTPLSLHDALPISKQYELFHILEERGELLPKYYGTLGENYLWNEDDYKKAIQYYLFPHSLSMADKFLFQEELVGLDRKSTRLNSSHVKISYAVFCL